jgi:hypothetical protein
LTYFPPDHSIWLLVDANSVEAVVAGNIDSGIDFMSMLEPCKKARLALADSR